MRKVCVDYQCYYVIGRAHNIVKVGSKKKRSKQEIAQANGLEAEMKRVCVSITYYVM